MRNEYIDRETVKKILEESMTKIAKEVNDNESPIVKGYLLAKDHAIDYVNLVPAADVVEKKDCEQCKYLHKSPWEYPCSHCRNCYTDKFKPKDGQRSGETHEN